MSEETRCQQVWKGLVAHINARMMIFRCCVQTVRRRCKTFPKQVLRYNFSHVNRPWKCRFCRKSTVDCGSRCASPPRGCTVCRQRMFLKSRRRSVKLWDRSQERDWWRTVEQFVCNQVPQIQEQDVEGCVHIISRADVPVVLSCQVPTTQTVQKTAEVPQV